MLALLGYLMVVAFMALIMTKRLAPILALILVPIAFGLMAGFRVELGPMMLDGIRQLAPTGVMLVFAIMFFGVMIDAGLFVPVVRLVLRFAKGDPLRVAIATAALALLVSLDGDGSTTYMITCAAMLPLYRRLGMQPLVLTCILMMSGHVMNILPWGGPTARAASALKLAPNDLFVPMLPAQAVTALYVFGVAAVLGFRERRRIGVKALSGLGPSREEAFEESEVPVSAHHRRMLPVNVSLTSALMVALVMELLPLAVLFMVAFALALLVNYPSPDEQRERVVAHAGNALPVAAMIFAAGIFTGILSGTGMVDAMAKSVAALVPAALAPYFAIVVAALSIPFTFFVSNDAFYFGILPILASAAGLAGFDAGEIGRASLIGQQVHLLSPLVPSTYLLVGLAKVELGDHQRYTLPWAFGAALVMLLAALATGVVPFVGNYAGGQ